MKFRKSIPDENRKVGIIFVISLIIIALLVAIFAVVLRVKSGKITTPAFFLNYGSMTQTDKYKKFTVEPTQVGDSHYVALKNIVADGASDPKTGKTSVFRVSITLETKNQNSSNAIINKTFFVVNSVRDVMRSIRPYDLGNERTLDAIKSAVRADIESQVGTGIVSDIYFEEIIGQ